MFISKKIIIFVVLHYEISNYKNNMKEYFRIITKIAKTPKEIWKDLLSLPSQPIAVLAVSDGLCNTSNVILSDSISTNTSQSNNTILKYISILQRSHGVVVSGACFHIKQALVFDW
jgi:hypothetical protein